MKEQDKEFVLHRWKMYVDRERSQSQVCLTDSSLEPIFRQGSVSPSADCVSQLGDARANGRSSEIEFNMLKTRSSISLSSSNEKSRANRNEEKGNMFLM